MNPFDYVNSINSSKKENLMVDEFAEKAYNPWLVNKALSYFKDSVLYANEINMNSHLSNRMQYDYYLMSSSLLLAACSLFRGSCSA